VGASAGGAWLVLVVAVLVAAPVMLLVMKALKVTELNPLLRRLPF
jgi:putative peptidoglycan lipid II flippase